nr:tetratricopeptide repeat protein [Woeseiaceae bacterium]
MRNYRAIQSLCRHSSLRLATLASVLLLSACQPSPEERLAAANQYMATGDYPAAIIEVKNALQADPDNAAARALLAEASYRVADFETATDEYRRALAGDESIDNYLGLGRSLLRSGNAVEAFDSVHEHLPDSSDDERVHVLMGEIYSALGNYANAQAAFQRAVDIEPASVGGLVGMAVVTGAQGDTAQARSLLIKATEADPSAARAWTVLGNFERVAGNLDAATAAYKKAVALDSPALPVSERFEARAALITTAIETRDLELAEGELALLQALLPGHPTLNYLRGQLAFVQGDADTAASEMQKYLSRVPNDARAQAVMGAISYSQNHFSQAEMYLQQARLGNAGESGNRAVNRLLAETRLRLNRPDDALAILSDSNASEIDDPALLGLLGRAEFSAGNRATAMEYFEQGRQAAPDDLAINLMYAVALLTEGRNDDAVEVLESLPPAADDTLHRRSMLLIAAQVRASDLTAARATADELIATNPEDAAAHAVVG